MGKLGLLAVAAAIVTLLNSLDVLPKYVKITVYSILALFGFILFLFDLIRFFDSPYPLRTRIADVVLSAILGDYYEQNRCWFNWRANLFGNQFYGKEVLFDKWSYPVLAVLGDEENAQPEDERNFVPKPVMEKRTQRTVFRTKNHLDAGWANVPNVDIRQIKDDDIGKVCYKDFTVGDCVLCLRVKIESLSKYKCILQMFFAGDAKPFAEQTEELTDSGRVETLFDILAASQSSPQTGIIDIRRGGVQGWRRKRVIYSFRIQDALTVIKDSNKRCGVFNYSHVDHSFWVL